MIPHFSMLNNHFPFLHSFFHSRKSTPLKRNSQKILTRCQTIVLRKHESADHSQFHAHNRGLYLVNVCVCVCVWVGGWEPLLADTPIQKNSKPPASVQSLWSVGKPRRVAERQSTSPESPDGLIWERREIHGTSPGFLAERLPYLVMNWGRRERSSQGWIRLNLYPGHMCVHDNMVAFFLCWVILRQLPG